MGEEKAESESIIEIPVEDTQPRMEVDLIETSSESDYVFKTAGRVTRTFVKPDRVDLPNMRHEVEVDEKGRRERAEKAEKERKQQESNEAAAEGIRRSARMNKPSTEGLTSAAQETRKKKRKRLNRLNIVKLEDLEQKYKGLDFSRTNYKDPETEEEATSGPLCKFWKEAMLEEYTALQGKNTWEEVPREQAGKVVKTKWIFKRKMHSDGKIDKFKARFVAKGFTQTQGLDVNETYASIMRHSSWRVLVALAMAGGFKILHWDIKTAFLNAELKEEVYIEPPKYFEKRSNVVYKLKKGLYGLQQAPREWQLELHNHLRKENFNQGRADKSVFTLATPKFGFTAAIGIWVDDLLVVVKPAAEKYVLDKISRKFPLEDKGEVKDFLGIRFIITPDGCRVTQAHYTKELLRRYKMQDAKFHYTPIVKGQKWSKDDCPSTDEERQKMLKVPYQSAVGALMYLAVCTRPDVMYAVTIAARFMHNPGEVHWKLVKRIFRYLQGTVEFGLWFKRTAHLRKLHLLGYSDASWASDDTDSYKSNSGYVAMVNDVPVSWRSIKQTTVAQSSTEAEYCAANMASKEICWLRNLLSDLGMYQRHPTVIWQDNQACIKIASNSDGHREASKHFAIKFLGLEESCVLGFVVLVYQPTELMTADILTKALDRMLFERHRSNMLTQVMLEPG